MWTTSSADPPSACSGCLRHKVSAIAPRPHRLAGARYTHAVVARRLASACFLVAVTALIASPFGLLAEPAAWVGVAIVFGLIGGGAYIFGNDKPALAGTEPAPTGHGLSYESLRMEKDRFFRNSPESPLTPEQRSQFRGLHYYPVRLAAAIPVHVQEFPEKAETPLITSTGDAMEFFRWGEVVFDLDGNHGRLTVYRADEGDSFFVPFADTTSGKETYGAGRYLELVDNEDGTYILDFNRAYNPFCAYNEGWSCPVPPAENRLPFPVEAGERTFEEIL